MSNNASELKRALLPLTIAAILAGPGLALAQSGNSDADDENLVLEEVVVTGSFIPGLSEDALPVTIMGADTIEKLGAINMAEVLAYIPSISDFEFEDTNNGTNGARGDVAGINMRGLGSGNTLALLNGRRLVAHPVAQTVNSVPVITYNVNAIPTPAIRRIEVLRDGAAPLYGADAIAGVVNFVPFTSFDGLRFSGKYGWSDDTNFEETEVTASGGFQFNEGRSSFGLFATWYDREHVRMDELDELYFNLNRRGSEAIPEEWRNDSQLDNRSSRTPWSQYRVGELRDDGVFEGATWHTSPTTGEPTRGSLPSSFNYNFNETAWVTPATERFNIMATFNHEFDNGLEFFGDAYYYDATTQTQRAASPIDDGLAFLIVPPDAANNPFPGQEVLLTRWRPNDLGPRIIDVDQDTWRVLGGVRGNWGDWDWESALVLSEATATDTEGNRMSKTLFIESLNSGPGGINPFALPGGNSEAQLASVRISSTDVRTSELRLWDLRLNNNDLFQTFGNDAGIAAGIEWREESYVDDRDERLDGSMPFDDGVNFDESDVVGVSATFDSEGSRDTYSVYTELYLPLIGEANATTLAKALEVQLAVRFEDPDDFSSTTKPKIGFRWQPFDAFSIRGSYTEGFRAPNLLQLNQGTIVRRLQGIEDPLREEVTGRAIDTGDTYRITTRLGNPDLDPEDAETVLIGFVFSPPDGPLAGLRFGADWGSIDQEGAIGIIGNDDQMELDALLRGQGSFNPNVIRADITADDQAAFDAWNAANPDDQRTPVGEVTNIISSYINLDPRSIEGWDAMVTYATREFGFGSFVFRGDMTKITKFEQQGLASADLQRRNGNPELRYTLALDWQLGGWDANITMRYIDDVYDSSLFDSVSSGNSGTVDTNLNRVYWDVDSWTTYNLSLGYDFASLGNSLEGLRLSGGVRNLFDEDPPFADESFGFLTGLHNSFGRILWLKADYAF